MYITKLKSRCDTEVTMIRKSSIFLIGTIATVLLMSGMITEEAAAFEAMDKEKKLMTKYAKFDQILNKICVQDIDNQTECDRIEQKQMKVLFKLNDLGVFESQQQPDLRHLTTQYDSTRAAAAAGLQAIEDEEDPHKITSDEIIPVGHCSSCGTTKTMYVKSAYKDPYVIFGITFYDHYSGVPSADIPSGITSSSFTPTWGGGDQSGIIPYCYTASIAMPTTASYGLAMTMTSATSTTLIYPSTTSESSYFVWYDPSDSKDYATQNNLASGPLIVCTISSVSVS